MRPIGAPGTHAGESRILHEIISTRRLVPRPRRGSRRRRAAALRRQRRPRVLRLPRRGATGSCCGRRRAVRAPTSAEIALERGEGLAWWAAEQKEPAFIRDNLLDDPRVKYVPELEEERFQSLVSVPIVGKDGTVIGVISIHTEAPREFTEDRGRVPRLERVARRRCDRKRPALRGDAAPRRRARAPHRAGRGDRRRGDARHGPARRRLALPRAPARGRVPPLPARPVERGAPAARVGADAGEARAEIGLTELGPELARRGRVARGRRPARRERRAARRPGRRGDRPRSTSRAPSRTRPRSRSRRSS